MGKSTISMAMLNNQRVYGIGLLPRWVTAWIRMVIFKSKMANFIHLIQVPKIGTTMVFFGCKDTMVPWKQNQLQYICLKNITIELVAYLSFFSALKWYFILFIVLCVCQILNHLPWRRTPSGSHPLPTGWKVKNLVKDSRIAMLKRYGKNDVKRENAGKMLMNTE